MRVSSVRQSYLLSVYQVSGRMGYESGTFSSDQRKYMSQVLSHPIKESSYILSVPYLAVVSAF